MPPSSVWFVLTKVDGVMTTNKYQKVANVTITGCSIVRHILPDNYLACREMNSCDVIGHSRFRDAEEKVEKDFSSVRYCRTRQLGRYICH